MKLSRREFLKASGFGVGGALLLGALEPSVDLASAYEVLCLKKRIGEKTTICPYDGPGCGFLVAAENGKVVNIEGDPDHPVNRGAGCAKGATIRQLSADNPRRLSKVLYRRPGGTEFEKKTWDWAIDEIARKIKTTRDATFIEKDSKGNTVNRTEVIANIGGAALDNEECYLLVKLARSLGIVYLEHQARL